MYKKENITQIVSKAVFQLILDKFIVLEKEMIVPTY